MHANAAAAATCRPQAEAKTWKLEVGTRKMEVDLTTLSSNYHVEMNPSDVGYKDRRAHARARAAAAAAAKEGCAQALAAAAAVAAASGSRPSPRPPANRRRYIVQEVIKEMAKARPIGADGTKGFKGALLAPPGGLPPPSFAPRPAATARRAAPRSDGAERG